MSKKKVKAKKSDLPVIMGTDGKVQVHCRFDKLEDPNSLQIHPANPARHPKEQVELLGKIITSHGIRHPIIVSALSGNIVAGHCRRESAILLGLEKYPVVVQSFLDSAQELAVLVADNQIQELAEIDGQTMADVLVELDQVNYPLELTALTEVEIHDYVLGPTGPTPQDDVVPDPPKKPKTKLGDLYLLGDHKLLCGDATKAADVERVMGGEKADMVFTDPPYNIDYGNIKHRKFKQRGMTNDNMTSVKFVAFCRSYVRLIAEVCDGCIFVFGPPGPDGRIIFGVLDEAFHCSTTIIWNKDQFTLGRGKYQNKYEPCWFGWNKGGASFCGDRTLTNVWDVARPKASKEHPTMKPVGLPQRAISDATTGRAVIYDPFLGSGTTIIAAEKLGRKCFGIEIDPVYVDVCVVRWETFTGKKAERIRNK